MGEVLRARDKVLGRTVALKILPVELARRPGLIEMFRAEAQAAALISHPGVVQVYDWGEEEETYYMVMEYVRGRNLRQVLASNGPLAPRQACEVMSQVLAALAAAHEQGLVHRDVKPENIMVSTKGVIKVADFGIARAAQAAGLTSGMVGTVAYVAPEQAKGGEIDGRTDIYSAGCVLYELLTGSLPFEGDAASILNQHLTQTVPPPSIQAPNARALDMVVDKATKRNRLDRYESVSRMRLDVLQAMATMPDAPALESLTREVTSEEAVESLKTSIVVRKRQRRRISWVTAAVLLVAMGAAGFFFRPTAVPELVGLKQETAAGRLSNVGLKPKYRRVFADAAAGVVFQSDPRPGRTVLRTSSVELSISKGPQLVDAPAVAGKPIDEAKRSIAASGLLLGRVEPRNDKQAQGTVLDQSPKPGRARKSDPMNLVVSAGPAIVDVPDVGGAPFSAAVTQLAGIGFDTTRIDAFGDAASGTVIGQSPRPGEKLEQGKVVQLTVSKGTQPFVLPDLKGKACADAKAQLGALGMSASVRSAGGQQATCAANKVLEQEPLPGSSGHKGQAATLYVT